MYSPKGMKNSIARLALVIAMGFLVTAGSPVTADAQEKTSKRAMKEMVVGARTAADHKAIADYYYAEATKALAKADEHEQMAEWYRTTVEGSKKIPYAPGTIDHCERLVKNYRATAEELTALAKEQEAIAGSPSTAAAKDKTSKPAAKEMTGGAKTATPAKDTMAKRAMKEMVAGAKTAADHKAIADYYYAEAAKARAKADEHEQMAEWYRTAGEGSKKTPYAPGTIDHCERLVKNYRATAEELTALAKEQETLAAKQNN
jgi:uncharacterized protein YacL (UPF0231 family)